MPGAKGSGNVHPILGQVTLSPKAREQLNPRHRGIREAAERRRKRGFAGPPAPPRSGFGRQQSY